MNGRQDITDFFAKRGWSVPWSRIKLIKDGWWLNLSRRFCGNDSTAATLFSEIHYQEPLSDAVFVHEIVHIWQQEKEKGFVLNYVKAHLSKGYWNNPYEAEARELSAEFMKGDKG